MSSDHPFVTVILPTHHGRAAMLKQALESLFLQDYPMQNLEIIVVDNASEDGTTEMISTMRDNAPCSLKYIRNEVDLAAGGSRQIGLKNAGGGHPRFH